MVKSRMTALDVRASVEEMQSTLIGLRLLNIYDMNEKKMFLFKFGHGENKKSVLLENGLRFHLTDLVREKPKVPSQFTLGLRKMVRAWRLDSVVQLQHDRTIDMCFGVAAEEGKSFHIIIELFGKGNIILTDHAYVIKVLLRTHKDADVNLRVGNTYPAEPVKDTATTTSTSATAARADGPEEVAGADEQRQEQLASLREEWMRTWERNGEDESVRSTLSGVRHFGPAVADHILTKSGVANKKKKELCADGVDPARIFDSLAQEMLAASDLARIPLPPGGYLIRNGSAAGSRKQKNDAEPAVVTERYDDFTPVLLAQFTKPSVTAVHMESFGRVCDTFFLPTEADKIDQHNDKRDKKAESKRDKFERDHQRRLTALEREQEISQRKGELLMLNADMVDEAIALINGALATGIQWDALKVLLRRRHADGHPVAYMIHELHLEKNSISVLLEQNDLYDDEDTVDVQPEVVEVSLAKTAHANASDYFTKKKANKSKLERTIAATEKAAAGAARKAERVAAKKETKKQIVKERVRAWWEKLLWFRTSAGDVVLQGKDVQTTEILIRRTMRLGDIFVHCDVPGALPCVLRPMQSAWSAAAGAAGADAHTPVTASPVSTKSLEEAGAWCVSRSGAWESKQSIGAWWVYASQITGGTASGCYLYRGERHTLLPQPLSLGCGLLFKVSRRIVDEANKEGGAPAELPALLPLTAGPDPAQAHISWVPADDAESLAPLPSVESLRRSQRKANQRTGPAASRAPHTDPTAQSHRRSPASQVQKDKHTTVPAVADDDDEEEEAEAVTCVVLKYPKNRKAKKVNKYFTASEAPQPHRNARANRPEGTDAEKKKHKGGKAGRDQDGATSEDEDDNLGDAGRGGASGPHQSLTRHQKKKLKKIRAKYGDQDDEDRQRGAMLNGNSLSKVQARELELQAAREHAEELARKREAKEAREKLKAQGKLSYQPASTSSDDEDEEDDDIDEVEEVSDFSEDAEGRTGVEGSSAHGAASQESFNRDEERHTEQADEGEEEEGREDKKGVEVSAAVAAAPQSAVHADTNLSPHALAAAQASDDELKRTLVYYTCCPTAEDVVDHVMCVCAPFSTLVTCGYTYRLEFACAVGNVKKGQQAQVVVESFLRLQKHSAEVAATAAAVREGDKGSGDGAASPPPSKKDASTRRGGAGPALPLVPTSTSLLAELQNLSTNDVVEQLRGNMKPLNVKHR